MKKMIFSMLLLISIAFSAQAQLPQTKWEGKMYAPDETYALLNFKKDTLEVFISNGDNLLETMTYTLTKDTMNLTKVVGQSPCDVTTIGKYKWSVKDGKLYISPLSDDCPERLRAWSSEPFTKKNN